MFEIEKIDKYDKLVVLEEEWNLLLNKSEINTIFLTHEWITNWWKYFGQDKELFVLVVKNNDKIVGIAPLMLTVSKILSIKTKKIQFIGTPLSDYCDFIIEEEKEKALKAIYNHLLKNRKLWNSISLEEIPAHSSSLSLSKNILKGMTKHFDIVFSNKCLSMTFKGMDYEELEKKLKKKDISKNMKYFNKNGSIISYEVTDLSEAYALLNIFFEQHIKIWDKKGIPSMFKEDKYKEFFINLTNELLPKGKVGIWVLKFNQKPISMQFGFDYNNKYLEYCITYDLEYSKKGPGTILNKFLLENYFQRGYKEVDFSRGTEPYKYRFANKTTNNLGINVHKNTITYMFSKVYNKTKENIMKNEKLHKFVSRYKNKVVHRLSTIPK